MPLTPQQMADFERLKKKQAHKSKDGFVNDNHRKWFGQSKVVDKKGKPLIVYHGSDQHIKQFDPARLQDEGFFFSNDETDADTYGSKITKAHLSLQNPYQVTWSQISEELNGDPSISPWSIGKEELINRGHDGFIVKADRKSKSHHEKYGEHEYGYDQYVAFHPHQIKSATGNRGTYDPNDPDITKARGGSIEANKQMIEDVYGKYPEHPFNPNQRAMMEGEGENQTLGTFELKPSMSARNAVELDWLSAYPHKQGVGSRTLKKLQEHATEHGVSMTLFPWEHGGVSQAKLMKFYKKHGFVPTVKGSKAMIWHPEKKARGGRVTHAHHLEIEERPL